MTTIAWDGKTLAADSQATCDGVPMYGVQKVFGFNSQHFERHDTAIGCAGDYSDMRKFVDWRRGDTSADYPTMADPDCFEAIVATRDGAEAYGGRSKYSMPIKNKFYATGSGKLAALGALYSGKTAREAVAIAIMLDVYSGGEIQEVSL